MKLSIRTRAIELTPALRDHLARRLHFALGRLVPAVRAVAVTLADDNGPRGGVDKRCQVRVRGDALPALVVESRADDLEAAIDDAASRAGRAVVRAQARRRGFAPALATSR